MKLRIEVSARFYGSTEIEIPDEEVAAHGGVNRYVDRAADEWATRVFNEGADVDADIDEIERWNEEDEVWDVIGVDEDDQ